MSRSERFAVLAGLASVLGVVARFLATGPMWLDEALSVHIASLPTRDLLTWLRHDGSPPLYYVLLHWWVGNVGDGPWAARLLSGGIAVATIPAAYAFARALAGRRVARVTVVLVATSPFAARYGAEARMYSLVQLLVALGGWALVRHLARPTWRNSLAVAVCSGLLALTHYWSFYLLAAVALWLAWRRSWRALGAVALGGVLFVPWVPSFLYQMKHTGTPWAPRAQPGALVDAVTEWGGGAGTAARFLGVALLLLAVLAVFGTGVDEHRVELDLRGRPLPRRLAGIVFGTLALGVLAGLVLGSGYAARYSAVVVVPFLVLCALGITAFGSDRLRYGVLAAVAVLGVCAAVPSVVHPRSQAGAVVDALDGDVGGLVVFCPDQLGPSVTSRLDTPAFGTDAFPTHGDGRLVDWVDYASRNAHADPVAFAREVVARASDEPIWLVHASGYRTFGSTCDVLVDALRAARPRNEVLVRARGRYQPERMGLIRFDP